MDFDMTQVVTQSDTEGEDEENEKGAPVAHIKVLNQPSLKKKLYPIHKGDNTVGRHDLCQISIPVRSLSKKHACIEVRGRSHFIYDMGSRNKTRRGTHYLTPEVRYELRNNDMVVFADVSCIYLVEDSARASDSGSETDPMSDSDTVFHTVAVDMYNSVEPTVNRVVEPELIDVAVTSDPNSCDSAASSDILMPTQDFAVMKIKQESQTQKEAIPSNESPVIKNASKEAIKFLVADSDSENEQENLKTKETLRFQNNGNNEDSLDLELLAAPTQAYVADSEDDDNKSEILDMVHDYKTTESPFFVADTQSDDSPKPPITDSKEHTDDQTDRNGSTSPAFPFRTSFAIDSPRTYSKKDACEKNKISKSINTAKKEEEKPVEEDCEETQDPNLFALSTLAPDENILGCPTSPDGKLSLASPSSNKNTTLNTTNDETETVAVDDKDTIPVSDEGATVPINSEEAETIPVTNDTATNNTSNTQIISDQEASVAVSDTIPVTSQNAISFLANKDSDNNLILNDKTSLLVSGQDLATVEIMTNETMVVALDIDVRDTETVEVDQLQEDTSQLKQSKEDNSDDEAPLKREEESDMTESKIHPKTCTTSTPSKEPSSPFQLFSDVGNVAKTQEKPVPIGTPVKGNPLNADLISDVNVGIFDVHVSVPLPVTPSAKGKSPRIPMRQSDDEILEATQPYMIDCLDSPPVQKKNVKSKRSLPFDVGITEESIGNNEDETQPYMLEDDTQAVESDSRSSCRRNADHAISDEEEDSVKASPKEKNLKNITSYEESETLSLLAENENGTDNIVSESERSQTSRSTAGRKKVQAIKSIKEETDTTSLKTGQVTKDVELTKIEELQGEKEFTNALKESSSLDNDKMTETSKPSKILQSEEACPSAFVALMILDEKRTTRKSSKEVCGEVAIQKPNKRGRKRKTAEEEEKKQSADNIALPVEEEEEIGSKTKKTRRSVHFIGISSSDENSQESTETRSSRSRRNLKESQEPKNETVGRKTRGRTSNVQEKGKKGTTSKKIGMTDTEENSSKGRRSRGRKSKIDDDDDDDDNQKDPQTTGKTEKDNLAKTSAIVNQRQNKRTTTDLDECGVMHNKNSTEETKSKKPRGRPSKANNDNQNEEVSETSEETKFLNSTEETKSKKPRGRPSKANNDNQNEEVSETSGNARIDGAEEMNVAMETSEEMPILENEMVKEVNAEILKKSSKVTSGPTIQSGTVEASIEEGEDDIKIDASKLTTKTAGQDLTEKTETERNEDSQKARTSRNTRSEKSKDEVGKEENLNDTETEVTEAPFNKRVSRTSKSQANSKTTTFEESEMVSENHSTIAPTPKRKKGRPRKAEKNNSQESEIAAEEAPVSNRASRSTKRTSEEGKNPKSTATTSRSSRSGRAKKEKDQDDEENTEKLSVKDKASQKHTENDSEKSADMDKATRTTRDRQKSKITKNSHKDDEASVVDDDNDDFVALVSRGQSSEKKAVLQEKSLSPPPRKNSNVSSDSFEGSESMDLTKQETKTTPTARKQSKSSQSSSQSSPFTTPKRHRLNSSLSPDTPSSRSLSSGSKPKVMFTGVADDKFQKIVTDLGGSVVMGFDSCTHLVTDKIRRTVKFLCCLARGIPIVSPSWLTNCKTAKMFTDHTTHIVSDSTTEKQYKFSLKNSLQHARMGPLLENYKIHVTKSVKPNVDQMKEIMDSCKAQFLKKMPSEEAENTIVISCEEDRTLCQPALDADIPIVNAEFILTGILQYSISVSKYQIFDSSSGSKRKLPGTDKGSTKRRRR